MNRPAIVLLALVLGGCRPPAPSSDATPPVQAEPAPARPVEMIGVVGVDGADGVNGAVGAEQPNTDARERAGVGPDATTWITPPGVGASVTACEQSCGEVHDCAVQERTYTPAAAAAIELGCVNACLRTPERATLFGCGRPAAIEPGACGPFLACVEVAWPRPGDADNGTHTPSLDPPSGIDPCARVCDVFARCWDPATTPELIEQCAEQCRQALDAEEERRFGRCADLPECSDVMTCVAETPKAT
jgi:hypothetical protein